MEASLLRSNIKDESDGLPTSVVVRPDRMERVDIGEYESGDLVPELVIECKADVPGNVSWTVSRHSMDDGAVRLLVFIQNYGSQAETVHIRQADS